MKKILSLSLTTFFLAATALYAHAAPSIPLETVPQNTPLEVVKHIERLYSKEAHTRLEAIEALAEMGDKAFAALPFLEALSGDAAGNYIGDKKAVNKTALFAIVKIAGAQNSIPLLKASLKYKPEKDSIKLTIENAGTCLTGEGIREEAARQLGILKEQSALDDLIEAADDTDANVRCAAIEALGALKAEKAVKKLIERKEDSSILVRYAAQTALKNISAAAGNKSDIATSGSFENEFQMHPALNKNNIDDSHESIFLSKKIDETNEPASAADVITQIKNKKIELSSGIKILTEMKTPPAGDYLIELIDSGDKAIKYSCISSLGKIKYSAAQKKLEDIFENDQDERARGLAAASLLEIEANGGLGYIDKFLTDSDRQVQKAAVEFIAARGGPSRTGLLIDLLKNGFNNDYHFSTSNNKLSVAAALEKTVKLEDTEAIRLLVATLSSTVITARKNAAIVLERIGWRPAGGKEAAMYYIALDNYFVCSRLDDNARAYIYNEAMLGMPSMRPVMISAMKYINDTASIDILIKLLYDEDEKVAKAAITTLKDRNDRKTLRAFADYLGCARRSDLKYLAALAMLETGGASAIEPVREFIARNEKGDLDLIYAVKKKLANVITADPGSIEYVVKELRSKDSSRIYDVIKGFDGPVKNDSIKNALISVLSTDESNGRKAAEILDESGWKPQTDTQEVYYNMAAGKNEALRANSLKYSEILIKEIAKAGTKDKTNMIIRALTFMKDKAALPVLINIAATCNEKMIKLEAIRALGSFADACAVETLINCLNDDYLNAAAVNSLAQIGDQRAVEPIIAAMRNGKIYNWLFINSISKFKGDSVIRVLKEFSSNDDSYIRSMAVNELKKHGINDICENKTPDIQAAGILTPKLSTTENKPAVSQKIEPKLILPPGGDNEETGNISEIFDNFDALIEKAFIEGEYNNDSTVNSLIQNFAGRLPGRLTPFLFCGNDNLDNTTLKILKKIGWKPQTQIESAAFTLAAKDRKSLQHAPPASLRFYIAEICDQYSPLRKKAAWCLGKIKPAPAGAAKKIADTAFSGDYSFRSEIIETLGELEDPAAIDSLSAYARDEESGMQEYAIKALGKIKGTSQVELLIKLLGHDYWRVREYAAKALADKNDDRAIEPLIKTLGDEDEEAAAAAGAALITIAKSNVFETSFKKIQEAFKTCDSAAARKFIKSLDEIRPAKSVETSEATFNKRQERLSIKAQNESPEVIDTADVELLAAKLRSHSFETRVLAAETLNKIKWVPRSSAEDTRYRFALQDMKAISQIDPEAAADVLIYEAGMDGEIRKAELALEALGFVKSRRAIKYLLNTAIEQYSWSRRPAAFKALLLNCGSSEIEAVARKFKNETDISQKKLQAEFLSKLTHPSAIKALSQAISDKNPDIRRFAVTAISGGTDEAALLELKKIACSDDDASIRRAALIALAGRGGKAAAAMLDERDALTAAAAIAAIDDQVFPACLATLETFLSSDKPILRKAAAEALKKFKWTPVSDNLKAYFCFAQNATLEISAYGPGPIKALTAEMGRTNSKIATDLLEFLRECKSAEINEAFMELLKSPDAKLCAMAISALGDIKYLKAEGAIREILNKNDSYAMSFMNNFYDQYSSPGPFMIKTQYEIGKACMLRAAAIEALYSITGEYCGKKTEKRDKPPKARAIFRIQKINIK